MTELHCTFHPLSQILVAKQVVYTLQAPSHCLEYDLRPHYFSYECVGMTQPQRRLVVAYIMKLIIYFVM